MKFRNEPIFWLQASVLLLLVFPFISPTFRDNDQAVILSGAWQIAHHQARFFHATFYNFDKQWGVFLALSWLYRLFPRVDPVLSANVLLTTITSVGWLSLAIRARRTAFALLFPILLSPVLILYMPFLGTAWFSLAFLLLASGFLRMHSAAGRGTGVLLVAIAASCRGDVVLAVPALVLSQIARRRLIFLLRTPLAWFVSAAALLPVLLGKWIAGASLPDRNPFSFDLRAYSGFLLFGLTPAVLLLLGVHTAAWSRVSCARSRFRLFYSLLAAAPFVPLGFYSLQMYTLRYLFLTLASLLFLVSSRRFGRFASSRAMQTALIVLTILPWVVGLRLPLLTQPGLTFANPTRFPTGDGMFPMGAYLGFAWQTRFRDRMTIDHNQKIWLAARSVNYEACTDGTVPFLITPMSNFVEFAIRLQDKRPLPIDFVAESPCGSAYVDARSVLRGIRPDRRDGPFFTYGMKFVSRRENGQLIVRIDSSKQQTTEARLLQDLSQEFSRRESEIFLRLPGQIPLTPGLRYALFSEHDCSRTGDSLIRASWTGKPGETSFAVNRSCFAPFAGWARTILPPYMGL